jgi:hypothetical protein
VTIRAACATGTVALVELMWAFETDVLVRSASVRLLTTWSSEKVRCGFSSRRISDSARAAGLPPLVASITVDPGG